MVVALFPHAQAHAAPVGVLSADARSRRTNARRSAEVAEEPRSRREGESSRPDGRGRSGRMGPEPREAHNPNRHARHAVVACPESRVRHGPVPLANALRVAQQRLHLGSRRDSVDGRRVGDLDATPSVPRSARHVRPRKNNLDVRDVASALARVGRLPQPHRTNIAADDACTRPSD